MQRHQSEIIRWGVPWNRLSLEWLWGNAPLLQPRQRAYRGSLHNQERPWTQLRGQCAQHQPLTSQVSRLSEPHSFFLQTCICSRSIPKKSTHAFPAPSTLLWSPAPPIRDIFCFCCEAQQFWLAHRTLWYPSTCGYARAWWSFGACRPSIDGSVHPKNFVKCFE
jgi:hypothetical protein